MIGDMLENLQIYNNGRRLVGPVTSKRQEEIKKYLKTKYNGNRLL